MDLLLCSTGCPQKRVLRFAQNDKDFGVKGLKRILGWEG
jgi:hypothetical protein